MSFKVPLNFNLQSMKLKVAVVVILLRCRQKGLSYKKQRIIQNHCHVSCDDRCRQLGRGDGYYESYAAKTPRRAKKRKAH